MSPNNYKSAQVYLERMIEHIDKISLYKKGLSLKKFKEQNQEYDAICMQLSQLGENVSKIEKCEDRIIDKFPTEVNWKSLKGLRNRIDHDYTWLEAEQLWEMIENNIDDLKVGVVNILKKRYGVIIKL
jgi:uncharacterized protein with HEPN domain